MVKFVTDKQVMKRRREQRKEFLKKHRYVWHSKWLKWLHHVIDTIGGAIACIIIVMAVITGHMSSKGLLLIPVVVVIDVVACNLIRKADSKEK